MQSFLSQKGYTPPAPSQTNPNDWHSLIKSPTPTTPSAPQPGYLDTVASNLKDNFQQGGQNVTNDISNTDNLAEQAGNSPLARGAAVGATAGHVAGDVAGTAGGIIGSAISPLLSDNIKNNIGDVTKHISDKVNAIPGMNPEIARSLGDVFNVLTLGGTGVIGGALKEIVGTGAKALEPALTKGAGIAGKAIDNAASKVSDAGAMVKEGFSPTATPEEATGQIIQGTPEDIAASKRALSNLDTRGVKSYSDLLTRINSEIKPLSEQVDKNLSRDPSAGKSIKGFDQSIGNGANAVNVNYVKQAITDLKNFYTKTNDAQGLSKVKSIENNAKIKGMALKDVNDLARLHGKDINAFNANGEAASGLTKQAAENTRMGLKDIARQGLGGTEAKAADAKLTDLFHTRDLIEKMATKVNSMVQKTPKQGVIPKTIGKVVSAGIKGADMISGNPLKAIGKEIGLGNSQSTMSVIDLEKNLPKNLRILRGK